MNIGISLLLHKILENNYNIKITDALRLQAHEHSAENLNKFFSEKNYYKIIIYFGSYITTWDIFHPHIHQKINMKSSQYLIAHTAQNHFPELKAF